MITLKAYQIERISKKVSKLGQCEWFRRTYGCTLEIYSQTQGDRYVLNFRTPKEETFFRIKYTDEINQLKHPMDELSNLIAAWQITSNS